MSTSDEPADPHVLVDGHLPTPFTAAEIRGATPAGSSIDTVVEEGGEIVSRHRTTFVECDEEGTTFEHVEIDEAGEPIGDVMSARSTWTDLQGHASFPAESAARVSQVVELPVGTLDCWRYEVAIGGRTSTFWFAKAHPGQPLRYAIGSDDGRHRVTTVTSMRRPS